MKTPHPARGRTGRDERRWHKDRSGSAQAGRALCREDLGRQATINKACSSAFCLMAAPWPNQAESSR